MPHSTDSEAWLRLSLIPGIGSGAMLLLLRSFGSPEAVLQASRGSLQAILPTRQVNALMQGAPADALVRSLAWLDEPDNRLITLADADYPQRLLQIADPPAVLYAKGRHNLLSSDSIAIVGSRNATPQGIQNAEAFAAELSQQGWCISSGLALGIDAAAHRGGLRGVGSTIAVVGTGLDIVYPSRNHALAHQIAADGLLLSEYALGTPAKAGHFPRRNRLISGLARGVLVVEAALQSGSLITAREAAEQGREVFAIPGSIHSPLAKGCHQLIKQGAKLVEAASDILEELGNGPIRQGVDLSEQALVTGEQAEDKLLAAMGHDPVDAATLASRCGLTVEEAYAMLLMLELDGQIAKLAGGQFQRLISC